MWLRGEKKENGGVVGESESQESFEGCSPDARIISKSINRLAAAIEKLAETQNFDDLGEERPQNLDMAGNPIA